MKPIVLGLMLAALAAAQKGPAFVPVEDVAGLPRVLLIGDSISIGYTVPVRELLQGKANVHRIPANGGPTSNGLAHIDEWLGEGKWDLIHFNWGLHDLKIMEDGQRQVPIEDYERNLRQLVARLNRTKARLVWASTTPVPAGKLNPPRESADVVAYNLVAKKIMTESGIAIDDLYGFALPVLEKIGLPVNVHYTEPGYRALGERVAAAILAELRR